MKFLFYILVFVSVFSLNAQGDNYVSIKNDFKKAIVSNDLESQKTVANKLISYYSTKQYAYYTVLLNSVSQNSILITNGVDDTYPLRILQLTKAVKPDINILSLDLMQNKDYRHFISNKYYLTLSSGNKPELINAFLNQREAKVCISTTVGTKSYSNYSGILYNQGLYLSANANSQQAKLKLFWNQVNNINWKNQTLSSSEKQLYQNYLPPLLTLYKLQLDSVNNDKLLRVINYVAEKVDKTEIVNQILETYKN